MRYDRQYGQGRGDERSSRRGRDVDYGWGVPVRGVYDYSLDYGGLSGPESEDSESIPGYESGPADWTGPRSRQPRYETHHWAAAEPAGESRYHGGDFASFRSALEAARDRGRSGYQRPYGRDFGWRGGGWARSFPGDRSREEGRAGSWGRISGGAGREEQEAFERGSGGGGWRGGEYDAHFWNRPRGRRSTFGPGRGFGGGRQGGGMGQGGWSDMPGMGRSGRERSSGGASDRGGEWMRYGPGSGYGRQLFEGRGGPGFAWRGSGMCWGESRGGRGQGSERGFGWPRQGAAYDPQRDSPLRESRGPRGRWGPYGDRVAPGGD